MTNAVRGEIAVELGGQSYTLRPTYAAIARAEALADAGIVKIANRLFEGDVRMSDIAAIVCAGIGDETLTLEAVGQKIAAQGLSDLMEPLGRYVAFILDPRGESGPREKKPDAGATPATPTPGAR